MEQERKMRATQLAKASRHAAHTAFEGETINRGETRAIATAPTIATFHVRPARHIRSYVHI